MITQEYTFGNLPKAVLNDENSLGLNWTREVEEYIKLEIGQYLNTRWSTDATNTDMILTVDVPESDAQSLEWFLHNVYFIK